VLNQAAVITVRYDFSVRALATDPAITLGLPPREMLRRDDNRPLIGVPVRSLPRADASPDHVVELAKSLASALLCAQIAARVSGASTGNSERGSTVAEASI